MDQSTLALFAGAILSLAFSYLPGLKDWFDTQTDVRKSQVMLLVLAAAAGLIFGAACAHIEIGLAVTCDQAGAVGLGRVFVLAVIANQGAFMLSPRTGDGDERRARALSKHVKPA